MYTYQDLLACGADEPRRVEFIRAAVAQHKVSEQYKKAEKADKYYDGENPAIIEYEKVIFDIMGRPQKDMYSANHKIASNFFARNVDQQVGYLLGNGVTFTNPETKDRLGTQEKPFDQQVYDAGELAVNQGVSFGFWNLNHIDVFTILEFVPLLDEENGALMSGIRFWQVDGDKPLRVTLYEIDGYTDYIQRPGEEMAVLNKKRPYQIFVRKSEADGTEIYDGRNYHSFPIVPYKNNKKCRSSLFGKQATIDALDICSSNMVNNADENIVFWILTNCCGMTYDDAQKFLDAVHKTHVAFMDNAEKGAHAEPRTIEAPYAGIQATIDMLKNRLYHDFQMFNSEAVSAGNQTATAIWATYEPLDLKTNKFERQTTEFINGILALAGIEDTPSYTRDKIINKMEETQTIVMGAEYVTPDYVTRKLLTIWGDADMAEQILDEMSAEDLDRFDGANTVSQDDDDDADGGVPTAEDAIDAAEDMTGKTLNGSQTSSLITVIKGLKSGDITEGQAVRILTTSIGVTREEALAIIRGEE